jgi:glycosyltransferase involved in cell wall biosynthesis
MEQERTQKSIADAINTGSYDVVLSEQDYYTKSPFLLKFVARPSLYYCQQPDRSQEAFVQMVARSGAGTRRTQWYRRKWENFRTRQNVDHDKRNASFASYIVTNSYFSRENILRVYGRNAFVSYLGTDIDLFRPLSGPREDYVLSVGSCFNTKGYDFLIRSLGLIDIKIRPRLVIASNMTDPRWEVYLGRLAGAVGVDLSIKKCVSDSELVSLYNKAKLFLYAPYLEPFGLAPLEAMACGTAVIAVKEGGVRESVLDNETGILTERDEQAFAKATAELLQDDAQRQRLGRRGREVVRSFWTWGQAAERLGSHLIRAASLRRG